MSPELQILCSPQRAFARFAAAPQRVTPLEACHRPAVVLLTLATAVSIAATGHVSAALVGSVIGCWSVVLVLQLCAAWAVIPSSSRHSLGTAKTLDLFFTGHAAWSLWVLLFALWAIVAPAEGRDARWPLASMALPMAWNAVIVFAFFRGALALPHRAALRRTIAHQAISLGVGFGTFLLAVAIWPRVIGTFVR